MSFDFKCVGLDIFYICQGIPKIPERVGDLHLEMISQKGLKVWPGEPPEGIDLDWFTCRYRGEGITDQGIKNLLIELEKHGSWEKIQKLWQDKAGKDLFSGAYEA